MRWLAILLLVAGCTSTGTRISPVTVPPYADCSGESPVDPCVLPSTDLGATSHDAGAPP